MESNQNEKQSPRKTEKSNLPSSLHRRIQGDESLDPDEQLNCSKGYAKLLFKFPPPTPLALIKKINVKEPSGIGKVKVMLRVSSGESNSFFTIDKRKKQVILSDPTLQSLIGADRRPTIVSPKIFAFDAIFTEQDSQTEICSNALTDVIHAVINGMDGCVFCFGHAGLGKTYTMLGTTMTSQTLGAIPCAITWLFRSINQQRQKTGTRFSVRVSCLELATGQEQLRDLLVTHIEDCKHSPLAYLRDDPVFGDLQQQQHHCELKAPTAERAAFYLDVAASAFQRNNEDKHMLYTLHVYQYNIVGKGGVAGGRSKLHLIDIGNSEQSKSSGGIPLSGLGNILLAIFNGQKNLPYKEHKLTQLLKECLGSLTCYATMIAHISSNIQQYNETLTTCQFASRIHHIRRKKIRFMSGNIQSNGSDSGSGEEVSKRKSECDPSSSDLSADTVIYVGPSNNDATDGEHPPIYIPSLNSYSNRYVMGKVLRDPLNEKSVKILEQRSQTNKMIKVTKTLSQMPTNQISLAQFTTPKASPIRKISLKTSTKITDSSVNKISMVISNNTSDEQWIDGPRISKSKVAEARNMLNDVTYKKETWIDGPMQLATDAQSHILLTQQHYNGCSFMDNHKKGMIRKWVENQSSQIQKIKHGCTPSYVHQATDVKVATNLTHFKDLTIFKICNNSIHSNNGNKSLSKTDKNYIKHNESEQLSEKIGAKLNLSNIKLSKESDLNLINNPFINNLEKLSKTLDIFDADDDSGGDGGDDDDEEEIIVPPPLPLIEPLSNGVSREVSMENLNMLHKDIISLQPSRQSLSLEDEIEVNDEEQVPMQDSCLQVTEEDIALCTRAIPIYKSIKDENPLKILSEKNFTVLATLTDSLSVLSEKQQYMSHFPPSIDMKMLSQPYFDNEYSLEQENQRKFDQLARLHELYQNKLALANVTNSLTYQRERSSITNVRQPQVSSTTGTFNLSSRYQSLSFSDVPFNDVASNYDSIYGEPTYLLNNSNQDKICDNCRQSIIRSTTAAFWNPTNVTHFNNSRRNCDNISSLRHPDGASNPNLKEEIERIPGNGASGSDPEEEYVEGKNLQTCTVTNINTTFFQKTSKTKIISKSDIQEKIKFPNGALGVLTSTLCGCFNGGTAGQVHAPNSSQNDSYSHIQMQLHESNGAGQIHANVHTLAWQKNIQDSQPSSAPS